MYELIARNRRMSWLLLIASFLLLAMVAGGVTLYLDAGVFGAVFGIIIAAGMTFTAYWKSDSVALAATRAQPASEDDYPRLHNLVEGLSLAAGIPKPRVYVVHDPAPNAFATGRDPENAAVAVTTGLMEVMSRTELEGVLAHELAHIRNYDIRVTTIAVATAGAIAIITDLFWRMLWVTGGTRSRSNNNNNSGGNPIALIAILVVLVMAPIAAGLIRAAVSRRREALADATAVEITRYPTGLRSALEKLADNTAVVAHASHATAHLWIESPLDREKGHEQAKLNSLFDTHPPLSERINALRELEGLDPWTGPSPSAQSPSAQSPSGRSPGRAGVAPGASAFAPPPPPSTPTAPSGPPTDRGWYADPGGSGQLRYWDGANWTQWVKPR